jgi:hypothetical protein
MIDALTIQTAITTPSSDSDDSKRPREASLPARIVAVPSTRGAEPARIPHLAAPLAPPVRRRVDFPARCRDIGRLAVRTGGRQRGRLLVPRFWFHVSSPLLSCIRQRGGDSFRPPIGPRSANRLHTHLRDQACQASPWSDSFRTACQGCRPGGRNANAETQVRMTSSLYTIATSAASRRARATAVR